jgi:hypothetical protein
MRRLLVSFVVLSLVALGCGSSAEGESCSTEGKVGGACDDGLVCGKQRLNDGELVCLKICNSEADCSGGSTCNGVSGSNFKGCRAPK